MEPYITALFHYPVKGLSPEPLEEVQLRTGEMVPYDRAWAFEVGPGNFDPDDPQFLPKINFLNIMRYSRLAALKSHFCLATQTLSIFQKDALVASGNITVPAGKRNLEEFLASFLKEEVPTTPRIVHADGHSFTDIPEKWIHIVNEATVREMSTSAGRPLDRLRFRANIYVDGMPPWAELDWMGKEIVIGDVKLRVTEKTERCNAVNVDPNLATRNTDLPSLIQLKTGERALGVYAEVIDGGLIRKSQQFTVN